MDRTSPENRMDILEFAIELEFCAYDLYKTMAENSKELVVKEMFYTLSQAEKRHLSLLVNHLGQGPDFAIEFFWDIIVLKRPWH